MAAAAAAEKHTLFLFNAVSFAQTAVKDHSKINIDRVFISILKIRSWFSSLSFRLLHYPPAEEENRKKLLKPLPALRGDSVNSVLRLKIAGFEESTRRAAKA